MVKSHIVVFNGGLINSMCFTIRTIVQWSKVKMALNHWTYGAMKRSELVTRRNPNEGRLIRMLHAIMYIRLISTALVKSDGKSALNDLLPE